MNVQQAVVEHRWVKPIDQLGLADAPSVGGKAANLGELTRARYPVPPGFAVTAEGYLEAMEKAGVRDTLRDHALPPAGADDSVLTAASQQLRATVLGVLMPAALRAEILGSYREFGAGSPRLAVRSSAPAEDAADTSFAGIHDSFIGVSGDDALIEAVTKCWASLWSERALTYRSVQGVTEEPSIAVVVQLMVGADQSGVVFTADPRTGARDRIVVEAATGLGEVVVGGQVEPDTYVVAKSGFAVIDAHIGSQSFSITADAEGQHSVEIPATARAGAFSPTSSSNDWRCSPSLSKTTTTFPRISSSSSTPIGCGSSRHDPSRHWTSPGPTRSSPPIDEQGPRPRPRRRSWNGDRPRPHSAVRIRCSPAVRGRDLGGTHDTPRLAPGAAPCSGDHHGRGGITCHAAIVGRELGRPVVVGTRTATSELVDGAIVTVDGDSGVVYDGAVAASVSSTPERGPFPLPHRDRRLTGSVGYRRRR